MNRGSQPREVFQVEKPHCNNNVYFHVCLYHEILTILIFLRYPMMVLFKGEKSLAYDTCSTNMSSFIFILKVFLQFISSLIEKC